MATRSGVQRREPKTHGDQSNSAFTAQVRQLSGWSSEELDALVEEFIVPDHWNGKPSAALLESIRYRIEVSDQTYKDLFPPIFHALNLKMPSRLTGMLAKVQRKVYQAKKTNFLILAEEIPGLTAAEGDVKEIGPHCKKNGITPASLLEGASGRKIDQKISNAMIIELHQYRRRSGTQWQVVQDKWWPSLFATNPCFGTIQSNWHFLSKKRQHLRGKELETFLDNTYLVPEKKSVPVVPNCSDSDDYSSDDFDDDSDLEFYPETISDSIVNHFADCIELITDLWQSEVESGLETHKELQNANKLMITLSEAVDDVMDINKTLKKELSSCKNKNVARRLERREKELEEEARENQRLNKKIQNLEAKVSKLQKAKKNSKDSRRYFKVGLLNSNEAKKTLRKQVKQLELESENLKCQLDEIMSDREIVSYENGKYTDDIRLTCFELISRGVSSSNVSDIIRIVLQDVVKMKVGRLPKPTLIRYLCIEQAMLSKEAARSKIAESSQPVTLHVDGTSKKKKGFTTFLASTEEGTVGMSLHDINTESAESLLKETEDTLNELLMLNVKNDSIQVKQLLSKVKNTMTDRCVVNKAYIMKLEKWRASVLPDVVEKWEELDDELKQQMSTINDMYCGKHLILNLQEYAAQALFEWEKIESEYGKIGREKKTLWSRGKEPATLAAVRSFCNLLGPDCDQQSGMTEDFQSILSSQFHTTSKLMAYRGNRFNVPFYNSAAVYYHRDHFSAMCLSLDPVKEQNTYIKCLKPDLEDEIILAGLRAMGIINQHISTPLMKMVESSLPVIATDKYYTRLQKKIMDWMIDPSPLVNDTSLLFEDFPPIKDELHKALYEQTSASIEHLTKQALSIILHNMLVCVNRQLVDHLPGGKFHEASRQLQEETATCPKDNLAAERMFAGLDRLKRLMPNANTCAYEGILLWSLNKTRSYLDEMSEATREQFMEQARQNRATFLKMYQRKSDTIKQLTTERLRQNKLKKEAKLRKLTKTAAENTSCALALCGRICNSDSDVNYLKNKMSQKDFEAALTSQVKHWKTASKGGLAKDLFHLTSKGKKLTAEQLETNLRTIINKVMTGHDHEDQPSTSTGLGTIDKAKEKDELKKKLLAKLSPTKKRRKGPFPGDMIIQKRICHSFLDAQEGNLLECKGLVLRKASEEDIEELVEAGDRKYIGTFSFYTIMYDEPYDELLCYPLEKEWDEGLLQLI